MGSPNPSPWNLASRHTHTLHVAKELVFIISPISWRVKKSGTGVTGLDDSSDCVLYSLEVQKTLQNQKSFLLDPNSGVEDESGTEEDQAAFMKELEIFHKERCLEFKPPRFYHLWRAIKLPQVMEIRDQTWWL